MQIDLKRIGRLFVAFLRLGLSAFGGPAMVAYIRELAVKKNEWLSEESFRQGVALCQSIPGATAMQAAAYVGFRVAGALGAFAAFLGFGLPAFVLMGTLAALYARAHDLAPVVSAFNGLQAIVVALVANATFSFGRSSIKNWRDGVLGLAAAAFLVAHGNPVLAIVLSALVALILYQGTDGPSHEESKFDGRSWFENLRTPLALVLAAAVGLFVLFVLDRRLFSLSALMMKVDLFAFGGGYTSVPIMLHEVVGARHWMDSKTFMDGIALGQVTPGPIVITATFVGYLLGGVVGAVVGTVSVFTPSLILLIATVPYFDRLRSSRLFQRALRGVLASFVGLLLAVTIQFGLALHWCWIQAVVGATAFAALRFKVDILWVVLAGACLSALVL